MHHWMLHAMHIVQSSFFTFDNRNLVLVTLSRVGKTHNLVDTMVVLTYG